MSIIQTIIDTTNKINTQNNIQNNIQNDTNNSNTNTKKSSKSKNKVKKTLQNTSLQTPQVTVICGDENSNDSVSSGSSGQMVTHVVLKKDGNKRYVFGILC